MRDEKIKTIGQNLYIVRYLLLLLTGQGPCLVTLSSDFGRKYATTTADFPAPLPDPPPPEYIPDFDGDGDCDFGDFSHFGKHWLEQPNP